MRNLIKKLVIGAVALALFIAPALPAAAETASDADRWEFVGEIYLWGADIGGEDVAGDDIDIPFSDLIDNLDMAFMGSVKGLKGGWSLFGDFIYLDVQDDITGTANIIGRPEKTKADVELKAYIGTMGVGHVVMETETSRVDVMLGARYLKLEADAEFELGSFRTKLSDSGDGWDGIVGIYGIANLNPKWYLNYYADVGTGESDLTWQASASISYRFDKFDTVLGYRYLDYEFDDDAELIDNLNISGPFAGVKFRF